MNDIPPSPSPRAAQRLAMLEELAGIGMELARALKVQALAALEPDGAETPKVTTGDPVAMFARVARAVLRTLASSLKPYPSAAVAGSASSVPAGGAFSTAL